MDILSTLLNNLNYFTVFILMLLESTVVHRRPRTF